MLAIRFFRVGKKNQPHFKIVVTEKSKPPRAGRFVEEVGFYNPIKKERGLKPDRIKYWLSVGAKPSDTVYNLLISEKIIEGKKIPVHKKSKKKEEPQAEIKEAPKAKPEAKKEVSEEKPTDPSPPKEATVEEAKKEKEAEGESAAE